VSLDDRAGGGGALGAVVKRGVLLKRGQLHRNWQARFCEVR
jgi:hypothetical protein